MAGIGTLPNRASFPSVLERKVPSERQGGKALSCGWFPKPIAPGEVQKSWKTGTFAVVFTSGGFYVKMAWQLWKMSYYHFS